MHKKKGMRITQVKNNKPRPNHVLSVRCADQVKQFDIHPALLTMSKYKLSPGTSAELYRDSDLGLIFTKITPSYYVLCLSQVRGSCSNDICSVHFKNQQYQIINHNSKFVVSGLNHVIDAVCIRLFEFPCVDFPKQNLYVHDSLPMALQQVVFKRSGIATNDDVKRAMRKRQDESHTETSIASMLSLNAARKFLFFNNNAISRIHSIYGTDLNYSRNLCLTVALAHCGRHHQPGLILADCLQYIPLDMQLQKELRQSCTKQVSCVTYIPKKQMLIQNDNSQILQKSPPTKEKTKVPLFALSEQTRSILDRAKVHVTSNSGLIAFTERNQPILIAKVDMHEISTSPFLQTSERMPLGNYERRRLANLIWLTHSNEIKNKYSLIHAATDDTGVFSSTSGIGLDLMACHELNKA